VRGCVVLIALRAGIPELLEEDFKVNHTDPVSADIADVTGKRAALDVK